MRLNLNNTYDDKVLSTDANKLIVKKKEDEVDFEPLCVFTENKPRRVVWRGAKKVVLFVDGAKKALLFGRETAELQLAWTKKEATAHVKKTVSQAHEEQKVIRMWQFAVIIVFLILIFLLELSRAGVSINV